MSEWISVKDRLPEMKGYYLVCYPFYNRQEINIVYFRGKSQWAKCSKYITHWMPLPEPPKKELY